MFKNKSNAPNETKPTIQECPIYHYDREFEGFKLRVKMSSGTIYETEQYFNRSLLVSPKMQAIKHANYLVIENDIELNTDHIELIKEIETFPSIKISENTLVHLYQNGFNKRHIIILKETLDAAITLTDEKEDESK